MPMLSVIAYEAVFIPGIETDGVAIALTVSVAPIPVGERDQNSFFPRMNFVASIVPKATTPTSPLPRSGPSGVCVLVCVGGAVNVPTYCAARFGSAAIAG